MDDPKTILILYTHTHIQHSKNNVICALALGNIVRTEEYGYDMKDRVVRARPAGCLFFSFFSYFHWFSLRRFLFEHGLTVEKGKTF
jgi:hypothetical protein